jgi:hypothetical protein
MQISVADSQNGHQGDKSGRYAYCPIYIIELVYYCVFSPAGRINIMLHHISLGVADIQKSMRFYDAVLSALGYVQVWQDICAEGDDNGDQAVGYGVAGGGDLFCCLCG